MPAYLRDEDVVALKWVGGYPANKARGLPYITGLVILNDAETGLPLAIMDGAEITAARTAAASGVCVRRFAPEGWRRAAILGCGEQGRFHAALLHAMNPDVEIRAWYPHPERVERLGELVEGASGWEDALAGAIYVSSSAVAVKGLIDFRRLADDETDLVLAILIVEDIVIAFVLAFAGGGGGELMDSLELAAKAIGFIAGSLAASRCEPSWRQPYAV